VASNIVEEEHKSICSKKSIAKLLPADSFVGLKFKVDLLDIVGGKSRLKGI